MIVVAAPLWLLLGPPLVAVAVWNWRSGPFNLGTRRKQAVLAVRIALIALIVLGLSGLSLSLPVARQAVVFVADRSASNARNTTAMQGAIDRAESMRAGDNLVGVVSTGADAGVEIPASQANAFDGFQTSVDATQTNVERGLELAAAGLPEGYRKRVVVMSDGQPTVGDALAAARVLHSQGVRVDVMAEKVTGGADVRVDRVDVPAQLHGRERFNVTALLHSGVNTRTGIDLYRDQNLVASREVSVPVGESQFAFPQYSPALGSHTYTVRITPKADALPENDAGSGLTTVQGAPRALIVTVTTGEAANVSRSLRGSGIDVDVRLPSQLTPTLTFLRQYAAVVLVDVPAAALDPAFMQQLIPYVRDLGRGLVAIGGQNAFSLGAYGNTPLDQVLPVTTQLPKRRQIPSVGVALIIESLEAPLPVDISKEAGKGVIKLLTEQDQVAVSGAPDNGLLAWAVPLQHPTNKASIYRLISRMRPGDPNSYTPLLESAFFALKRSNARIKHIMLLGDGDAHAADYRSVVSAIRAGGVTVSTVVTNAETQADFQTMRDIAKWGGGRYYRADDPGNIPRLFLREAHTFARSGVVSGRFFPRETSSNPILRDLPNVPALTGYVATGAKPSAEVVLASAKHDPVLATWQFGLGRAAAWTSDAAGLWTRNWLTAPGSNRFWTNLVSWTFPSGSDSSLYVSTAGSAGQGSVSVEVPQSLGLSPSVTAHILTPNLHTATVTLQPSAPGRFQGAFPASAQGAYFVTVTARNGRHMVEGQSGLDVPYSAEYRSVGTNSAWLTSLAAAGGGSLISRPDQVWSNNLAAVNDQRSLADLLWLLALVLFPADVALRRLVIRKPQTARSQSPAGAPAAARVTASTTAPPSRGVRVPAAPLSGLAPLAGRIGRQAARVRSPSPSSMPRPTVSASSNRPSSPTNPQVGGQSTAGKLLEAKRRRRAEEAAPG